jgi:holliday junction DNA helicase RuvA
LSLIAALSGTIEGKTLDQALVRVGGVVFAVAAPLPTLSQLAVGKEATLFTHLIVREDDLALYGFAKTEERDLFVKLIGVSGVGARLGLAMLSTLSPEALCRAIVGEDIDRLARTPGIGKKLAQRLALELKAPLAKFLATLPAGADGEDLAAIATAATSPGSRQEDVIDALTGLGYTAGEAQIALRSIPDASSLPLDELIVRVLRILAR